MAVYTDSQLNDRIDATLPTNHAGDIDAAELKALLKDINDSKLNIAATIGIPEHGTIEAADLTDGEVTIPHTLNTAFPVIFIKSYWTDGDIWSAIHFSYGPSGSDAVWIHFEEDFPVGSSVEYIIVKF